MSADHSDTTQRKPDLLKLWMGEPEVQPPPPPSLARRLVQMLLALGAIVIAVLLAKYAVDVLVILLALLVTGLVLHIVGTRLAESTLLTPGTFAIAASVVLLFAYAFLAPADGVFSLSRFVPASVRTFLTWSEEQGWAGRALSVQPAAAPSADAAVPRVPGQTAPADATQAPPPPASGAGATVPSASVPPPSNAPVSLSVSGPRSSPGQPVVLIARLGQGTDHAEVEFYDGVSLLGRASVRTEGGARVAYLTVTALSPGEHDLRAAVPGPGGLWSQRSQPVRHTVIR